MERKRLRTSIVVPAYNEARHIASCLEAIAAQRVKPHEVIVVDNNSTDGTASIVKRFPFVRLLHEARQGIGYARNCGFDAATGDIIARIDADTRLPADWTEQIEGYFADERSGKQVLTGGARFYNLRTGRVTARIYNFVIYQTNRLLLGHYFPWGSNSALPKEAWLNVRVAASVRPDIHEDLDLGICLHAVGYRIVYRPDIRVGVRARRIMSEHSKLWPYLAMWPRTFFINHMRRGMLVWLAAVGVWLGSYGIFATERLLSVVTPRQHAA